MDLHMRQFDGVTFGMEAQNPAAGRTLKKKVYYAEATPKGGYCQIKRRCVAAKYVAAVMGQVSWLVAEHHLMEAVRWDDSGDIYIICKENTKGDAPDVPCCPIQH